MKNTLSKMGMLLGILAMFAIAALPQKQAAQE